MLKIFKKKETKKVWKVAYDDAVIHYGAVVAVFDNYEDAIKFKEEREKNDKSIEWFIF
jgi:hypothetical protein